MDKVIKSLSEILANKGYEKISNLLQFSKHSINKSSSFGSRAHSVLSTFEIISPPVQTSKLSGLGEVEQREIFEAVLMIFPIKDDSPEIDQIIFVADINMSSENEFVQTIDDDTLINDISVAMNMLARKPPKFWKEYKAGISNLLEDDFRSEFYRILGLKYQIGSEEESRIGRTDLIIKSNSLSRRIFEFKVWGRSDYKFVPTQLLGYLTEIDDIGFVIMCNNSKNNNISPNEYEKIIKTPEYIEGSLQIKTTSHGIQYFEAGYRLMGNQKKIYHFLLNLQ